MFHVADTAAIVKRPWTSHRDAGQLLCPVACKRQCLVAGLLDRRKQNFSFCLGGKYAQYRRCLAIRVAQNCGRYMRDSQIKRQNRT
jgi:hypothetical protein